MPGPGYGAGRAGGRRRLLALGLAAGVVWGGLGAFADDAAPVRFSHARGFHDAPFLLVLESDPPGRTIRYTRDGSEPTAVAEHYTDPLMVDATVVVRARAFEGGLPPSRTVTHTYLFAGDIVRQPTMNPEVVGHPEWGPRLENSLKALPVLALATDPAHLYDEATGLWEHPHERGVAWERPVSAEWFEHGREGGFAVDCGLRVYGGSSRQRPKKTLRLLFKGMYGPTKLHYPVFGDDASAATAFDTLILRGGSNDPFETNGLVDPFVRRLQLAMGHPGSRATFVHLYLNGVYWGLYNPSERCDQGFGAQYFGVRKSEWDGVNAGKPTGESQIESFLKMRYAVTRHVRDADGLRELEGLGRDGFPEPGRPAWLAIDPFIDYMLLHLWAGTGDWPRHNWYAGAARTGGAGWRFFIWDAEMSFRSLDTDITDTEGPVELHRLLLANPEYGRRLAARARRHCQGDGVLTPEWVTAIYRRLVADAQPGIVANAARWGDTYTPVIWQQNQTELIETHFPQRTPILLNQLAARGLIAPGDEGLPEAP